MARYTGPVCKLCRREGVKLFLKGERCFTPKCAMEGNRRPYAPGQHGPRRRKMSEYGVRLREKQRARHIYGLMEQQFRKYFTAAAKRPGATGEIMLQLLERRLDNVVYRLGLAESRAQARQLVRHGHFAVNAIKTNIPSFLVKPGDTIAVREGSQHREYFQALRAVLARRSVPPWLSLNPEAMEGRVLSLPARDDIDATLREHFIVEYYSR